MPYTPPSAQSSPSSSRNPTPTLSRNSSYSHESGLTNNTSSANRPNLPRSISSTTYLNKHRRSPSVTSPTSPSCLDNQYQRLTVVKDAESLSSLRQSPPPVNNLIIPTGAILSPPDSLENSDGDESSGRSARRREVENTWNELQQAVRSMSIKRDPSPLNNDKVQSDSEPHTQVTSPSSLAPTARKIAHSRSSTETAIIAPSFTDSPTQATNSDDSDEDDDNIRMHRKPPLVRKKSGELVKPALRPSSRRRYSSMPGTPTYSKSVHFNDNGNQTRHFLQVDKPSAVSANTSPTDTAYESENEFPFESRASKVEWDIKLTNFPEDRPERRVKPVYVERIFLSADNKSLIGQVAVANISFSKSVAARFTLDYWKTTSEVAAEFNHDVRKQNSVDGYDRFNFSIRLVDQANLETKTLLLCVRYNVIGQEHWDNNENSNYQIDFVKRVIVPPKNAPKSSLGARPLNAIPRSRHSPPVSRGRPRAPSFDDEMSSQQDTSSTYHFGASAQDLLGDDQTTIKLKPKSKRSGNPFAPGQAQSSGGLGGRYDFGASLSAALVNAQDKLGKQSGLLQRPNQVARASSGYFTKEAAVDEQPARSPSPERPEDLTTGRPAMGSAQYKDLVSKFCYFTPAAGAKLSPNPVNVPQPDKTANANDETKTQENTDSGDDTPSPPQSLSPMLDGTDETSMAPSGLSPFISRSASPGQSPRSGMSSGSRSPAKYGYPFKRDGYLSDSPTPTAIRG